MKWAVTPKALNAIRQALKEKDHKFVQVGKRNLNRLLKVAKMEPSQRTIQLMLNHFGLRTPQELYLRFGQGTIKTDQIVFFLKEESGGFYNYLRKRFQRSTKSLSPALVEAVTQSLAVTTLLFGPEELQLDHTLATCCRPIPGDAVFGYLHPTDGIIVHRSDCPKAVAIQSRYAQRSILAQWKRESSAHFIAYLHLSGIDSQGLIHNVTRIISNDLRIDIRSLSISGNNGVFSGDLMVSVADRSHLQNLVKKLKEVPGIAKVERSKTVL